MYLSIYLGIGATQSMSSGDWKDPVVLSAVTIISNARVFYIIMYNHSCVNRSQNPWGCFESRPQHIIREFLWE